MSGSIRQRTRKTHDLEDLVEDALESPFNALEGIFDSLGDLFGESDLHSDGTTSNVRNDMEKLKADLHRMKRDLGRKKKAMPPCEPVMPPNVSLSGGATFSIGNTGKKHKHFMKLKDEEGNFIEVTFNNPADLAIRTEGTIDTHIMEEVKRHIRQQLSDKNSTNVPPTKETHGVEEPTRKRSPLLWTRSWRGERKNPLDPFSPTESKVTVAGHSMFGRKYEVAIDGTTIYIVKIEEMMENCHRRGDLDTFVDMWTDEEKAIMLKVFNGLEALEIIEDHHKAVRELISP